MRNGKLHIFLFLILTNLSLLGNKYTINGFVFLKADNSPISNYPVKIYTNLNDTTQSYTIYTKENGNFYYTWSECLSNKIIVKINNYDNEYYSPIIDTINIIDLTQSFKYYITPNFLKKYIIKGQVLNIVDSSQLSNINLFICSKSTNGICHNVLTNSRGLYIDSLFIYNQQSPNVSVSVFDNCTNKIIEINDIEFHNYISENNFSICPPSDMITLDYYFQRYPLKKIVYFCGITNSNYDSLKWDFGDGTTSNIIECLHQYNHEGIFKVKLKIFVNSKEYEETKFISVGDIINLTGEVYTTISKLPYGYALAFQKDSKGINYIDKTEIINGHFEFSNIYKSKYYIYAVPEFDIDTNYFPKYLATYYSDNTEWQSAKVVNLAKEDSININLNYYPEIFYGSNKIKIKVDKSLFKLSNIVVILLINSDGEIIESKLTQKNNNIVFFEKLPKDIYNVKIEIPGIYSPLAQVDLINNNNDFVNFRMIDSGMIFYTTDIYEDDIKTNEKIKIFPNPCSNLLYFSGDIENTKVMVYSSDGRLIKNTKTNNGNINISNLPSGNYFINFISNDGKIIEQKLFIKN